MHGSYPPTKQTPSPDLRALEERVSRDGAVVGAGVLIPLVTHKRQSQDTDRDNGGQREGESHLLDLSLGCEVGEHVASPRADDLGKKLNGFKIILQSY